MSRVLAQARHRDSAYDNDWVWFENEDKYTYSYKCAGCNLALRIDTEALIAANYAATCDCCLHENKFVPEYVTCIVKPNDTHTWCGIKINFFTFVDVDHAVVNGMNGGRLMTCPDCWDKVKLVTEENVWRRDKL